MHYCLGHACLILTMVILVLIHTTLETQNGSRCGIMITGCALAQHCYNGDVRFLWEKWELWPPVKFKPLSKLSQNLSQLIMSMRGTFIQSLVKIRSRGTSVEIGEMSLSCDFFFWGTRRDQTLWPILTHDGSKCAESRKDVPFRGLNI